MGGYPINNLIDCSYDRSHSEWCYIPNSQSGQFYILLITNYYGNPGTITFNTVPQSPGATTDCSLLAQVSNNGPVCTGSTIHLTCNNPQPNATYLWNGPNGFTSTLPNPIIPNATISNSGVYSLIITVNGQSSTPANTNVIVNAAPNIVLSSATTDICLGNSTTLTASGATSYIWSNGLGTGNSKTVSPISTTTYTVTGTLSGCTDTAHITINIIQKPITELSPPNTLYCPNNGSINISTSTTFGGGIYSYNWVGNGINNINSNNTQLSINSNDCNEFYNVIVTATDQFGCFGKDTAQYHVIDITPPIINNLPFTIQIANGTFPNYTVPDFSTLVLNNSSDNCYSNNQLIYNQTPPSGTPITNETYVQASVTDPCGNSKSVIIRVILPLFAYFSDSVNVSCYNGNNGSATLAIHGGVSPYLITWNGAPVQNTQNFNSLTAGTYQASIMDSLGSTFLISVQISQPTAITSSISMTPVLCNGQNNGTAQISVSGGVPAYTYLWSTGATSNPINNLNAGIYHVTVTDHNNCTKQDSILITQPTQITITSINNPPICESDLGFIQITANGGNPPYNYSWSNGMTSNLIENLGSGIYTCTITDMNGCIKTQTDTIISINPMIIDHVSSNMETCYQQNGSIAISIQNGTLPYNYQWNNGLTTGTNLSNLKSGYYQITVTDQNLCVDTTSIFVDLFDIQAFIESITPSICERNDGSITIRVEGGFGNYEFNWYNLNHFNNNYAYNLAGGQYNVSIKELDCIDTINFIINEIQKPIACFETSTNIGLLINQSFLVTNCSQNATQYHWDFGDGATSQIENPNHFYNTSGLKYITLTAINDYDCVDSITHSVMVYECPIIYIPNSFTPNGDGLNDTFLPICTYVKENGYSMRIFNRWGQEIFYSTDYNYGWDGNYNGVPAPSGTYSYIIIYENLFGQQFKKIGSVNILR